MSPARSPTTVWPNRHPTIICMIETSTLGCDQARALILDRLRGLRDLASIEVDLDSFGEADERFFRCSLRARDAVGRIVEATFAAAQDWDAFEGAIRRLRHGWDRTPEIEEYERVRLGGRRA